MKLFSLFIASLLLVLIGSLTACLNEQGQQGVAALVNGSPIPLRLIEARHDADKNLAIIAQNPSVELLQQQYGAILTELIAQELVIQELERLGLGVTDEDVDRAMHEVRKDYENGSFSEALLEGLVDEKTWRALLRYTVGMRRFNEQVLRPNIRLDADEVEKYYADHVDEFVAPARLSLLVLTGPSREAVAEACKRVLGGGKNVRWSDLPEVLSQRVDIRPDALPEIWRDEIPKLAVGKGTSIKETNEIFHCLILEKINPERRLSPVEAYLQIEQVLVDLRMEESFARWLDAAMNRAGIKVASMLLPPGKSGQDKNPETSLAEDDDPYDSEPVLDGPNEENNGDAAVETE